MHWGIAVSTVYIASLKYGKLDCICRIRHGVDPKRLCILKKYIFLIVIKVNLTKSIDP